MPYIDQNKKKEINTLLKPILKKYGVKGTLSINNHMALTLTIREGDIDFIGDYVNTTNYQVLDRDLLTYIDVNPYHYQSHFTGMARNFLDEAFDILNNGNWNNSDSSIDYFDVGWYVHVYIGKWNKPYKLTRPFVKL
jgi:hypothetical protein